MDRNTVVNIGEKIHGLSPVKRLDAGLVDRLWLKVGKSLFDRMDIEGCYAYRTHIIQHIQPELQTVWEGYPDKHYVVQCGDAIYISEYGFKELDQDDLANRMEFLATIILRPTVTREATIIPFNNSDKTARRS